MAAMIPEQGIGRARLLDAGGEESPCPDHSPPFFLLAFATALCAQDGAVPPLEGTVIRLLGNTHWRSAVELHAPAFSPAGDPLARLCRVQVARQEEKAAVDRHGDPLPRTHADKQSAVTLLLASVNG
jgi:hypothetical protein